MKTAFQILWVLVFFLGSFAAQAQTTELYLKITDYSNEPVPFLKVGISVETGGATQYSITDTKGIAIYKVTSGVNYKVFDEKGTPFTLVYIPENSASYVTQKVVWPEPEILLSNKITIDTVTQYTLDVQRPDSGNIFFKIGLFNHMNQPVKNMEVRIFNENTRTVYLSKTSPQGFASFHVPGKSKYVVGVAQFERFDTVSVPHYSYSAIFTYIPTQITETDKADTVTQDKGPNFRTTTDRALVKVFVQNHERKMLANEQVYFCQVGTPKVYMAQTATDGSVTVLLPKGYQYDLSFKYERNVYRFDFPMTPTLYSSSLLMTYIGSQKVEEFYQTAERTNGLRSSFMEVAVSPATMPAGILQKTATGFNLNFPDNGPILTPAAYNDKLLVSAGYYNPDIFCLNYQTGAFIWGVKLAENGASVLVISDGIMLINTQSCTLYAIDLEKGVLAWSKWLGPNIYHSPAVANGRVYAAYPDGLTYGVGDFVLASFDLKTGAVIWQSRMDTEPIAAPVVAENQVLITDSKGTMVCFNAENGSTTGFLRSQALSLPVVFNQKVWANVKLNKTTSQLASFNPNGFTDAQYFGTITDTILNPFMGSLNASERMSYAQNRLLVDKSVMFQINRRGLTAFTDMGIKVKWNMPIKNQNKARSFITFAGSNLLLATPDARLKLIDANLGTVLKDYPVYGILSSEPIVHKGWIYCGTQNGKLVAINTKNTALTGWSQFGMNGAHNPVR